MPRRLMGGRLEMRVAKAAATTPRDHRLLAGRHEIGQQRPRRIVKDGRTRRDVEDQVIAGLAMAARALTAPAGGRLEVVLVLEVTQRRLASIDVQVDGPTASAVTTVRTAAGNVRLLAEGRGPVATIAGADPDLHAVEEHRGHSRMGSGRRRAGACACAASVRLEVTERIDALTAVPHRAAPDFEVEVRAGREARRTHPADALATADGLTPA